MLLPLTEPLWREFASWFTARNVPIPPIPEEGVFVADRLGLLCGACLYPTARGPFVFAEYLPTNPAAPMKLREALDLLLANRSIVKDGKGGGTTYRAT
jgi:hypothetical protein